MAKMMMYNVTEECGRWEDLNPKILALILVRILAKERVATASLVCKSWMACVLGPFCWVDIDIQEWCRYHYLGAEYVNFTVRKLVCRNRGMFYRLFAFGLGDVGFAFAANCLNVRTYLIHLSENTYDRLWLELVNFITRNRFLAFVFSIGKHLNVLEILMSEVNDKIVEKFVESLTNLIALDISYCLKITQVGIETLGKNCKSLSQLKRNMPPLELERFGSTSKLDDREAMVIADTMALLQHLQLGFGCFGECSLDAILSQCKALTRLDIQGCWNVKLEGELEDRYLQLLAFKSPWIYDIIFYRDEQDDNDVYPYLNSE
ncbi:hypothetical protein REPUB_Repub08aG0148500 [Reevesia pubescens]